MNKHANASAKSRAKTAAPVVELGAEQHAPMRGADILVKCLEREGVDTVFAYPGGASMEMHQALTRSKIIRTVLPRHEQGGAFAAEGYARASGKCGVAIATSGPGATNLVTGVADAFMDSIPLILITGQVPRPMIGKGAFQETDVFGLALPIVKHSYLVMNVEDIPRVVKEAFYIANTGRPGPVWIDIPIATTLMGIGAIPTDHELSMSWLGMHGTVTANYAVDKSDLLLALGVRFDDRVTGKVSEFAKHGTIVHIDVDPSEINKNKVAHLPIVSDIKYALQQLNRVVKGKQQFRAWHAQIAEWKKQYPFRYRVTDEVLKSQYVREFLQGDVNEIVMPQYVVELLSELTKGEAILTTGVGQHQMWAGQYYKFKHPRTFLTSAGLGAMGYGYPAAMGAKVAFPDKEVIDIDGDGSFLMNIQELATAHIERIAAKALVINNQHLGMVVQWEDKFYNSNRGHTYLGDPQNPHKIYPDFVTIAKGLNVPAERVTRKSELRGAMKRMLESKEPYVLDVIVPFTEHVLPMIPAGKTVKEIIIEKDAKPVLGTNLGL